MAGCTFSTLIHGIKGSFNTQEQNLTHRAETWREGGGEGVGGRGWTHKAQEHILKATPPKAKCH